MTEVPDGKVGNGTAVGVSALVAGVAGLLVTTLFPRRESRRQRARQQVERRLDAIESQALQAVDQVSKVVDGLNARYPEDSRRAKRRARAVRASATRAAERSVAAAKRQIADLEREARHLQSLERANQLGSEGSNRARELAHALNERTTHLIAATRSNLPEWRTRTVKSASAALESGSTLARQAVHDAPHLREQLTEATSLALARGSDAAHHAFDEAPAVTGKVQASLTSVAHEGARVVGEARAASPDIAAKVAETAHHVAGLAREQAPQVRERARTYASEASGQVRKLAHEAQVQAPGLAEAVGSQVATAFHEAQHAAKPVADDLAARASRLAEEAGETILPELQHRVDDATERLRTQGAATAASLSALGSTAVDRLADTSEVIEQQSRAAASAAGRGTKDGGAFLAWTAVAGGIVYYAFLDRDQRRRVNEAGKRIFAEAQDVYRDIRGRDEEFS